MNISVKSIILFLLITTILSSCINELPFKNSDIKPKIIMNAYINSDSIHHILYLNYTGQQYFGDVKEANVEICVNGTNQLPVIQLPFGGNYDNRKQMRFQINHKFNPGDNVRIDAYTDDGQHAWVEETVPQPPLPIENVDTASVLKNFQSSYYTEFLRFDITIKDKPEEKNYYRLILERRQRYLAPTYDEHFNYIADSIIYAKKYKIYNYEDMILTDGFPIIGGSIDELEERPENIYNVFNDNSFNGSSATLRIYKDIDYYSGDLLDYECYVRIQSIDERTFMNYKILNLIDSEVFDYGYPEAIIVDSNVNGGTGLVSFSSETSVYMKLR